MSIQNKLTVVPTFGVSTSTVWPVLSTSPSSLRHRRLTTAPTLPARLIRNYKLETRLDELIRSQSVISIAAPRGAGKRTAVASWLRFGCDDRDVIWIRPMSSGSHPIDAISLVSEALADLVGWPSQPITDEPAQRRAAAERMADRMKKEAVLVLEASALDLEASELHELIGFVLGCWKLRLVVISDTTEAVARAAGIRPDLNDDDFCLTAQSLHKAAFEHQVPLTEEASRSLLIDLKGSPLCAAAFFESVLSNAQPTTEEALSLAQASVLSSTAEQLMGDGGRELLVLLTLVPELSRRFLESHYADAPLEESLEILTSRGLLEFYRGPDSDFMYRLADTLKESIRAQTIGYYIRNRSTLHRTASSYLISRGDLASAVDQLLILRDEQAAVEVLCAHWDGFVRSHNALEAQELFRKISPNVIQASLEASVALWLVHSTLPESKSLAPYAARILTAKDAEIGLLDLRGRLMTRTATMLACLERGRLERAEALLLDAVSDLQRTDGHSRASLGGVYAEFVLAAGKTALWGGGIRRSAAFYDEAIALAESSDDVVLHYRALIGRAQTLAYNGELGASQAMLDQAAEIAERFGLQSIKAAMGWSWCQSIIWTYQDRFENLKQEGRLAAERAEGYKMWLDPARFIKAIVLLRGGFFVESASVLRNMLGSLSAQHDAPLLRDTAASMLGLSLIISNQAGAALEAMRRESSGESHAVCFEGLRALAETARGNAVVALEITDSCLQLGHDHAIVSLPFVYIGRALAFESLGLLNAATDAFLVAVGVAGNAGLKIPFEGLMGSHFHGLVERARAFAPMMMEANSSVLKMLSLAAETSQAHRGMAAFTAKEREILQHLVGRDTLGMIAAQLFVSENTVKTHTKNIYRKLGVKSRREAADLAVGCGLSPTPGHVSR